MPGYSHPRLHHGTKTHHSIEGELLHVGDHVFSGIEKRQAVIGIDNSTAITAIENSWNVKVAPKGSQFLGGLVSETFLYLTMDIPKHFDETKFSWLRLMQYLSGKHKAVVDITAIPWYYDSADGMADKNGIRLYLEEIYSPETEPEPDEYDKYVEASRAAAMPVMSRTSFYNRKARQEREDRYQSEREFANRDNQRKTHWNVGDPVVVSGVEYQVAHIDEIGNFFNLKLERKFTPGMYLRVPK